jgi:PAS domain S-box-containing protein
VPKSVTGAAEHVLTLDVLKLPDPAFSVDMNHRIVVWNDAAEKVLGHTAEEVAGAYCFDVMRSAVVEGQQGCWTECAGVVNARHGRPTPAFEVRVRGPQDAHRWLHVSFFTARSASGQKRVVHWLRDVTYYHHLDETVGRIMGQSVAHPAHAEPIARKHPEHLSQPDAVQLTRREREVLRLLVRGLATAEIAGALSVSPITARNHVTNLMEKLGASTRLQAVAIASRRGLL